MLRIERPIMSPNADPEKLPSSRWQKGTSGNPGGRPRGSRNKATLLMEQLLEDYSGPLIQKVIASALEGDADAMRLCVERLVPRCKERAVEFELGPTGDLTQILAATCNVFAAIASGQLTPPEGAQVYNMLHAKAGMMAGKF